MRLLTHYSLVLTPSVGDLNLTLVEQTIRPSQRSTFQQIDSLWVPWNSGSHEGRRLLQQALAKSWDTTMIMRALNTESA